MIDLTVKGGDSCHGLAESTENTSHLERQQQRGHHQEKEAAAVGEGETEGAAGKPPLGSGAAALHKRARESANKRRAAERVSQVANGNFKAADGRWPDEKRGRRGVGLLKQQAS